MSYSNKSRNAYSDNKKKTTSAITVRVETVARHMMSLDNKFKAAAVHAPHVTFERECIFAKHIINNSEYLTDIAITNPHSFETAFLQLASSGLTLDPAQKQCYLVPREGRVILDVSYIGLSRMATDEGLCQDIVAELVFENDVFKPKGRRQSPEHEFDPYANKGDLILTTSDKGVVGNRGNFRGAYIDYLMKDGRNLVFFITVQDLAAARAVSESWKKTEKRAYSPWTTFPWKMVLKSAIKQTIHLIPGNRTRLSTIIEYLNSYGEEGFRTTGKVPVEAAVAEMSQRYAAKAAENDVTASSSHTGDVIEGEIVNREESAPNVQSASQKEHIDQAEFNDTIESQPEVPMSDIPGVRQATFKRIAKLVTRAEKTLAYETMLAELKDAFAFNESEIAYAQRTLEQSRRDLLSSKVHQSIDDCDFTVVHNFIDKLAECEFKNKAIAWVTSVSEETDTIRQLYESALSSGNFSELESILQNIKFEPLKHKISGLIQTAKAA